MASVASTVLLLAGAALAVVAGVGLHRFPDVFARMHAATKPATLGLALILGGAALRAESLGDATKLLLVLALQLVTAPVGAHLVGRAAYRAGTELSEGTVVDELSTRGGSGQHESSAGAERQDRRQEGPPTR